LDVSKKEDFFEYSKEVKKDFGKVNMIINNAGVAMSYKASEMDLKDFEWLMNINFWGVVYGTMAFLPMLKEIPQG